MVNDVESHPVPAAEPALASTLTGIPDQWLVIGLLLLGAVLSETSFAQMFRLPVNMASFVAATPDLWIPLLTVVMLIVIALGLEARGRTGKQVAPLWMVAGPVAIAGLIWFFRSGDLDWHATQDWVKEWSYHQAWRESLSRGQLPWILTTSFQGSDLFFAIAETNVAPHVILLAWFEVSTFVVAQGVALLALGLMAAYQLARDLRLGPVASLAFLMIFLMNGHPVAHLETGHGQWAGYFAFPCMFLYLHRAATGDLSGRTQAGLALALALIELVGGWHLFVWWVIFIAVFVAIDRTRWRFGAALALLVAGLSALRILPAIAFYAGADRDFVGSYQRLSVLVGALVGNARNVTDNLDWWEYDAFVGWAGLVIVAAGLTVPLSRLWRNSITALWMPSVVLLVLSTFNIYRWTLFQLPGFVSERVATRLVILAVLGFALIGCVQLNTWLARRPVSRVRLAALALAGLLLATQLVTHTNGRRPRADRGIGPPSMNVVSGRQPERLYVVSVQSGALVTLISFGIAIRMWRRDPQTAIVRSQPAC